MNKTDTPPTGYKHTEIGLLPEDWECVPIGKVADIIGGGTPSTNKLEFWNGEINWFTPTEIKGKKYYYTSKRKISKIGLETSSARLLKIGTILMTSRASIGDLGILKEGACTNQGFQSLSVFDKYNNEYIYYVMLNKKNDLLSLASGSTFLEISPNKVKQIKIPLPPKRHEQEKIATMLSDVDDYIGSLEKLIEKKRNIKQGAMQRLLNPFDDNGKMKEGWQEKRLGDTATLKARIGWQGLTTAEYMDTGDYYLITGTEFNNGSIDWDKCHFVEEKRYKQDRNIQIKNNDILVTKDGTIGKVAFIRNMKIPATLNSGVFVIRAINNAFNQAFFFYVLMSKIFTNFLNQLTAGSTINHLYQKDFVNFIYYIPEDMNQQANIAQILSDMDSEIEALEGKLSKVKNIKQGMMQKLLTGQIRLVKPCNRTQEVVA